MTLRTCTAWILAVCAISANASSLSAAAQRQAVERGLRPKVDVAGEAPAHWNLVDRMRRYGVPTVSIALIEHGRIAWSATYRSDGSVRVPAGHERFQAASLSKGLTGSLAAVLASRGVLDLDAPVDACLAPLRLPPGKQDAAHPVTLSNLLHHTAGATVNGFPGYPADASIPSAEQVILGQPPANTPAVRIESIPGQQYAYSGGGYTLAQLAIEHCAKAPFTTLMDRYVLGPAGMRESTFAQPLPAKVPHAIGHEANGEAIPGGAHIYPELAAAGLWTTAEDLARWLIAVRAAYRGEPAFLSRQAATAMLAPGLGHYGLGVFVSGEGAAQRFMHEGGNAGFKSKYVMFLEDDAGAVLLTDSDNGRYLNNELAKAVADALGWPGFAPRTVRRGTLDADAMARHIGRYTIDTPDDEGDRFVTLGHEGTNWFLVLPGLGKTPLIAKGAMTFVSTELGYDIAVGMDGGLTIGTVHATPVGKPQ